MPTTKSLIESSDKASLHYQQSINIEHAHSSKNWLDSPEIQAILYGDAIRMVGHLLDGRSTTHSWARNNRNEPVDEEYPSACKFCVHGAILLVSRKLKLDSDMLTNYVKSALGVRGLLNTWDTASDKDRQGFINKLKEYK